MADWQKINSRGEVEDRRTMTPTVVGGISLAGVALYLVMNYLGGGSLSTGLQEVGQMIVDQEVQPAQNQDKSQFAGEDPYEIFAATVLGSTDEAWSKWFAEAGKTYPKPKLVLFREATQSSCGGATSQVGPHYCSADKTIYLDETFFDEMESRFGAEAGDVAQAYVISHEVGHHIQNLLGDLKRLANGDNEISVKIELQADCYAGLWASTIKNQGVLEPGEIREAMDAAGALGDDKIQEKAQGYSNPETFTHGTAEDRVKWFTRGYEQGSLEACNTF